MSDIVIIDGCRTPQGNLGGVLKDLTAQKLGEHVLKGLLKRTGVNTEIIDEVIFGCVGQFSDAPNIARVIALNSGIPIKTPSFTVQRNCASGIQAIVSGCQSIKSGDAEIIIAGGTESMSSAPYVNRDMRFGKRLKHSTFIDTLWEGLTDPVCNMLMGGTAENLATEFNITRAEQDKFAVESHKKAFRATREGRFKEEIIPISIPKKSAGRDVSPDIISDDEGINIGLTEQVLSLYPTIFKENGTVTPGNACPITDGASAVLIMTEKKASELGLKPLGKILSYAFVGVEPERMGIGPAYAVPVALKKAGLTLPDIGLIEINEAFAAQSLSCGKVLGLDFSKVNVNGGAIALGHPLASTGTRIITTLLFEMKRRQVKYGVATLCIGGGQGAAVVLERS